MIETPKDLPKDVEDRLAEIDASLTYLGTFFETRTTALAEEYERFAAGYDRIDRRITESLQRIRQQDMVLNEMKGEITRLSQHIIKS